MSLESNHQYFNSDIKIFTHNSDYQKTWLIKNFTITDICRRENFLQENPLLHQKYLLAISNWDQYTSTFIFHAKEHLLDLPIIDDQSTASNFQLSLKKWKIANENIRAEFYFQYWKTNKVPEWKDNINLKRYQKIYQNNYFQQNNCVPLPDQIALNTKKIYFSQEKELKLEETKNTNKLISWPYWLNNKYLRELELLYRFCQILENHNL